MEKLSASVEELHEEVRVLGIQLDLILKKLDIFVGFSNSSATTPSTQTYSNKSDECKEYLMSKSSRTTTEKEASIQQRMLSKIPLRIASSDLLSPLVTKSTLTEHELYRRRLAINLTQQQVQSNDDFSAPLSSLGASETHEPLPPSESPLKAEVLFNAFDVVDSKIIAKELNFERSFNDESNQKRFSLWDSSETDAQYQNSDESAVKNRNERSLSPSNLNRDSEKLSALLGLQSPKRCSIAPSPSVSNPVGPFSDGHAFEPIHHSIPIISEHEVFPSHPSKTNFPYSPLTEEEKSAGQHPLAILVHQDNINKFAVARSSRTSSKTFQIKEVSFATDTTDNFVQKKSKTFMGTPVPNNILRKLNDSVESKKINCSLKPSSLNEDLNVRDMSIDDSFLTATDVSPKQLQQGHKKIENKRELYAGSATANLSDLVVSCENGGYYDQLLTLLRNEVEQESDYPLLDPCETGWDNYSCIGRNSSVDSDESY